MLATPVMYSRLSLRASWALTHALITPPADFDKKRPMASVEVVVRDGDRQFLVMVEENSTAAAVKEKFSELCKGDPLLAEQVKKTIPLFVTEHRKFGQIEVSGESAIQDGQIFTVKWASLTDQTNNTSDKAIVDPENNNTSEKAIADPEREHDMHMNEATNTYIPEFNVAVIAVEGGICEVQEMKSHNDVFDALVHQLQELIPYSEEHNKAVLEMRGRISSGSREMTTLETLDCVGRSLGTKIVLYRHENKTLIVNPSGQKTAKLVLQDEKYHSCIIFTPFTEKDESEPETESDYSAVRQYFSSDKWNEFPEYERKRYKNIHDMYMFMTSRNVKVNKPSFMAPEPSTLPPKSKVTINKEPGVPTRVSDRISTNEKVTYTEKRVTKPTKGTKLKRVAEAAKENGPKKKKSDTQTEENSASRQPLVGINNQQSLDTSVRLPVLDSTQDSTSTNCTLEKKTKDFRTFDQMIGYPAPKCPFGSKSLAEIAKPALTRNIRPIHADCKAHIRSITGGYELLTPKEWNNYCRTVVEDHPNVGSEDSENSWALFKLSLQKSFSAERKNLKKHLENKQNKQPEDETEEIEQPVSDGQQALLELMAGETTDRRKIKELLDRSLDERKVQRGLLQPEEHLEKFKTHLSVPELMIYDYLSIQNLSLDDLERTFNENCVLIGNHYDITPDDEMAKVKILMEVHKFFMSAPVTRGKAKPVIIIHEENKDGLEQMDSSEVQAPFLVLLTKLDFVTGCTEVTSATLVMANKVISSLTKPEAAKAAILLLAAYFTMNIEYPGPYQQFLRALEKLTTGTCAKSKYGSSQKKYEKFVSLIKQ